MSALKILFTNFSYFPYVYWLQFIAHLRMHECSVQHYCFSASFENSPLDFNALVLKQHVNVVHWRDVSACCRLMARAFCYFNECIFLFCFLQFLKSSPHRSLFLRQSRPRVHLSKTLTLSLSIPTDSFFSNARVLYEKDTCS